MPPAKDDVTTAGIGAPPGVSMPPAATVSDDGALVAQALAEHRAAAAKAEVKVEFVAAKEKTDKEAASLAHVTVTIAGNRRISQAVTDASTRDAAELGVLRVALAQLGVQVGA